MTRYKYVDTDGVNNVYVIGDLHGKFEDLISEMKRVRFNPEKDILICTGDIIDRGQNSLKCLSLLYEPWFHMVNGNHEYMAFDVFNADNDKSEQNFRERQWFGNGGDWYFDSTDKDSSEAKKLILECKHNNPDVIVFNYRNKKIVVAHAYYPTPYERNKNIEINTLIWDRKYYDRLKSGDVSDNKLGYADLGIYGHNHVPTLEVYGNQAYVAKQGDAVIYDVKKLLDLVAPK